MQLNRRFVIYEAFLLLLVLLLSGVGSRLRASSGSCSGQTITNSQSEDVTAPMAFFPPIPS